MKGTIFPLLAVQMLVLVQSASCADTTEQQVKALMQRYTEVEGQLDQSAHYLKKEGSEPETTVEQAWFNGAGDLLKVATERASAAGRELRILPL
jgi:uncharacterized protein YgbK (DUF1537 family)